MTLRATPRNPLAQSIRSVQPRGPQPSERTEQLLRRYDLLDELDGDRSELITRLASLATDESLHEHQYAMAELAYLGAKRAEGRRRAQAVELYGASLLYAYGYLFDPADGLVCNPYDPQFRGACDLYNQSLEGLLRLVQQEGDLRPGDSRTLQTPNHTCSFDVVLRSTGWHAEDVNKFLFVSDYEVNGLRNHYHTYGLGVPLIALRQAHEDADPAERFYPNNLCFPLTAFLRIDDDNAEAGADSVPGADSDLPRAPHFVLELHDPLDRQTLSVNHHKAPLETDLSTPLAFFLNQPEFQEKDLSTLGLLRPDKLKEVQGLYMLEPYDPNKMPVVMVHGLWSSPATWMEMFNDLRSEPLVRQHYQFWFYLYPTGQPFWESASQFRGDLASMRRALDPEHRLPALDQTVLVGHSMGGLVSKLQSVDSGQQFWRTNSDRPFEALDADPEVRDALADSYFFQPSPSVRRVVTIGTPHHGSEFANGFTRWVSAKVIDAPMQMLNGQRQLFARNHDYFRPDSSLAIRTSIDSLDPKSPWLPVLASAEPGPWIDYHNIVGRVPENTVRGILTREGDGIVAIESARLDGQPRLKSQVIVPADHLTVHRHPQSILEVRRILFEQLADLQSPGYGLHEAIAREDQPDRSVSTASAEQAVALPAK